MHTYEPFFPFILKFGSFPLCTALQIRFQLQELRFIHRYSEFNVYWKNCVVQASISWCSKKDSFPSPILRVVQWIDFLYKYHYTSFAFDGCFSWSWWKADMNICLLLKEFTNWIHSYLSKAHFRQMAILIQTPLYPQCCENCKSSYWARSWPKTTGKACT